MRERKVGRGKEKAEEGRGRGRREMGKKLEEKVRKGGDMTEKGRK